MKEQKKHPQVEHNNKSLRDRVYSSLVPMLGVIFPEILSSSRGVSRASILVLYFVPRFFVPLIQTRHIQTRSNRLLHRVHQRGHVRLLRVCGEHQFQAYEEYSEKMILSREYGNVPKFRSLYFSKIFLSSFTTAFSHAFIANQPISGRAITRNHFL